MGPSSSRKKIRKISWLCSVVEGQADIENGSLADFALESKGSAMLFHHNRPRYGQALPCPSPYFLCGEEGVEDFVMDSFGDATPGITDRDDDTVFLIFCPDTDESFLIGPLLEQLWPRDQCHRESVQELWGFPFRDTPNPPFLQIFSVPLTFQD